MTDAPAADSSSVRWYCARTQVKREHLAARHLRQLEGVEVFCPRLRYRKATARGRIWWVEPLFPGYLLARFELEGLKRQVSHSPGISGLVSFGQEVPSIPDEFVQSLKHEILEHHEPEDDEETITTSPLIEIGDEVELADGPLRGMSGEVIQVAPAEERVKVLLEFLGQKQVVDLDLFSLLLPRKPLPNQSKGST